MAGYRLPALPGNDVVGPPEGVPEGANPRVASLTHLKKTWRDQFGTFPGGPRLRNMQCCGITSRRVECAAEGGRSTSDACM